jgi:predicted XRE-type DNA-binding protein
MATKFRDLIARKPAAWHAAVEGRKRQLLAEMPLHELRRPRQLSQERLAEELDLTQPEISKIEHRTDE